MKYKCVCQTCGKIFVCKSKKRKYCCSECRKIANQLKKDECDQPCWNCKKATGNCSWSREFKPVKGWEAESVYKKEKDGYVRRTYKIISCPSYVYGRG